MVKIKAVLYEYKGHRNHYLDLDDTKIKLYSYYQKPHKFNGLQYKKFHALVEVGKRHGGTLCRDEVLVEIEAKIIDKDFDLSNAEISTRISIKSISRNKALAIAFLKISDRFRYSCLLDSLENKISLGTDQYPIDLPSSFTPLYCFVKPATTTP